MNEVIELDQHSLPQPEGDDIILEVKDLKKYFPMRRKTLFGPRHYVQAVDGVSFSVRRSRTLGIVGESGCGKTTVGRMIVRLLPATAGQVLFEGEDILQYSGSKMATLHQQIQFIFQDPYASLNPKMKIGEILNEPLLLYHREMSRAQRQREMESLLERVGLSANAAERYPHEFSGGQRQRVGIARSLTLHPKLVICDEPVSALDVSIQSQILNLLQDLQKELGLTYIFIAHGLNVIKHISDDVVVMYLGKVMEYTTVDRLFAAPTHPYTQALMAAIPYPDPEKKMAVRALDGEVTSLVDIPCRCRFCTRCPKATEKCFSEEPPLTQWQPGHFVSCFYPQA